MSWPKGKPRGPRKPKTEKAQPSDGMEFDDDLQAYVPRKPKQEEQKLEFTEARTVPYPQDMIDALPSSGAEERPAGPYTVWVDYGYEGWKPEDFNTLQEALEFRSYGHRQIIMKPVKYEVREVGENIERFRPVAVEDIPQGDGRAADDVGPPIDPSDPDSGKARYV